MEDIFVRCSTIADSLTKAGYKQVMQVLQIPLHRITDSASNGSVFPDVTERISASADQ